MCRIQGQPLSEQEVQKIVKLLESTEMSLPEIAKRMDCTRSAIAKINRLHEVRIYEGRRSSWRSGRQLQET